MANMTITIHDDHVPRVLDAFTAELGLPQAAVAEDVRQWIIERLKEVTLHQERMAVAETPLDVT